MSEWIKKLTAKYAEVNINESKILIPEEIPTAERNAYMGAAAAAHKAGKTHFDFNGKKHPVTMKKDTATAIADQKESKKAMGEEEEVVMNPKKDKKEKKDANAEAEMAAEAKIDEISMDKATRTYAARKSQAQSAAHQGSMDYAKKQMAKARKTKAYMDKRESVEEDTMATPEGRKKIAAGAVAHHKAMVKKWGANHPATKDAAKAAEVHVKKAMESVINELDKKTLGSYIKKAGTDADVQRAKAQRHADAGDMADKDKDMYKHYSKSQRAMDKAKNRVKGINKAVDKLTAESKQASLAKKLAKASASSQKGKDAVTLPKAPWDKKEEVKLTREEKAPVYSKILENRSTHYKKAAKTQEWDDTEKSNKGAQDMRSDHAVDDTGKVSNYDKLGHDDASKANKAGPNAKPRSNDNKAGDKKIMNPVAGAVTKE